MNLENMRKGTFRKPVYSEYIAKQEAKKRSVKPKMTYRQAKAKKQKVRYGVKIWSVTKADIEFSKWLRAVRGRCEYGRELNPDCTDTEGLTNSHYIGRREYATRFDPENCDCFCFSCHSKLEARKMFEYRDWKISKMGQEAHDKLSAKKLTYKGSTEAIRDCMILLGKISS